MAIPAGALRLTTPLATMGTYSSSAGTWKLKNYTLDRTGFDQKKKSEPKAEASILDVLTDALGPAVSGQTPRSTTVAATATSKYKAVEVKEGETIEMPFGPPYLPKVDVQYRQGTNQVSLGLSLVDWVGLSWNSAATMPSSSLPTPTWIWPRAQSSLAQWARQASDALRPGGSWRTVRWRMTC